jgi:hypothetical protein
VEWIWGYIYLYGVLGYGYMGYLLIQYWLFGIGISIVVYVGYGVIWGKLAILFYCGVCLGYVVQIPSRLVG